MVGCSLGSACSLEELVQRDEELVRVRVRARVRVGVGVKVS